MNSLRLKILASACFAVLAGFASAQSASPLADTFTYNFEPGSNFGSQPILVVQQGANSYIRFNSAANYKASDVITFGISGPPSFVIGKSASDQIDGVRVVGAVPYSVFESAINDKLSPK